MSNFSGKHYNQTAVLQFQLATQVMDRYSDYFSLANTILDIGCGDGALTAQLAQHYPQATLSGIDPSASMIAFACDNYADERLQFLQGSAEELNESGKYDLIVSFSALQWTQLDLAFARIAQALTPQGHCLLMYYACTDLIWLPVEIVAKRKPWSDYFEHFTHRYHFYDVDCSVLLAQAAGLTVLHAEAPWHQVPLANLAAYQSMLSSFLPHLEALPDAQSKSQFLAEVSAEFQLLSYQDKNGCWILPGRTIELIATSTK